PMLMPRVHHTGVASCGRIYICGGATSWDERGPQNIQRSVECFSPESGEWEPVAAMAMPRIGACASAMVAEPRAV
ncbi:unnamed protein product, partial [Prorocentrum cordatum]